MSALALWCHRHRRLVLAGWISAIVTLAITVLAWGTSFTTSTTMPNSESAESYQLLAQATGGTDITSGTLVWSADGTSVTDPSVAAKVTSVLEKAAAMPGVAAVISPYSDAGAAQISADGTTAFATVALTPAADIETVRESLMAANDPTIHAAVGGTAFDTVPEASHGTEAIGVIIALIIIFAIFRSWWAAMLPIVTGVAGVAASLLAVMLASHAVDLADTSLTMGALIGLGVGIDYALFIVNRFRKSLIAGRSVPEAIREALTTSGRAVIFAGVTVVIALLGMFVVGLGVLTGMAQAAALTVVLTVLAAITLLPALLGMLGRKVLPRSLRVAADDPTSTAPAASAAHTPRLAARWATLVARRPLTIGLAALALVTVIALPATQIRVGDSDASSDPAGSTTRDYYDMTSEAFGAGFDATVLLAARTPDPAAQQAFSTLIADLPLVDGVAAAQLSASSADGSIQVAAVTPTASAGSTETADLVHTLRNDQIPAAERGTTLEVLVGGKTASSVDLSDALMGRLPLYLGLIAVLGFVLLAMAFRSILVPLVGALSNLATIAVGLGAVTAIFQFGWGSELLGVGSGAPIMYIIPVMIVGVIFGLSMDYQVFLVSRMHEEWVVTGDNRRAIRVGAAETGQVIAAAATIMLAVFASFGFSGERIVSALGIGMALAVVIDAFVLRMTLVPAVMQLIGRANWWYPAWAERITPHLAVEGSEQNDDEAERDDELATVSV